MLLYAPISQCYGHYQFVSTQVPLPHPTPFESITTVTSNNIWHMQELSNSSWPNTVVILSFVKCFHQKVPNRWQDVFINVNVDSKNKYSSNVMPMFTSYHVFPFVFAPYALTKLCGYINYCHQWWFLSVKLSSKCSWPIGDKLVIFQNRRCNCKDCQFCDQHNYTRFHLSLWRASSIHLTEI